MPEELYDWWTWVTIAFVPVMIWFWVRDQRRQRQVVREWAESNHVTLVRRVPTWFRVSPFVWTVLLGGHQKIELWIVKDSVGLEHRVWFKIGSFFRGATRDIEAEWET